jgi:hypothetical protein
MSFSFFHKNSEQEGRTDTDPGLGELVHVGGRRIRDEERGFRRVNVAKYCVHMYVNGKMIPETVPGIRGGRIKENDEGG